MNEEQRDFAMVNFPTSGKPLRSRTQGAGSSGSMFCSEELLCIIEPTSISICAICIETSNYHFQ